MRHEDVGVVVIGRNEGPRLLRCLNSLRVAVKCIVYVDSGSTDNSVEDARKRGLTVVSVDIARPFTAARARNEGFMALMLRKPETRFVQFIDGDCELVEGWLDKAVNFLLERPDVAVVCGRRRERNPEASIYNRVCDIEWNTSVGQVEACGGDSLVRVDKFAAVGGFRATLIAHEEPELCVRLRAIGCKIWRLEAEMTRHDAAIHEFRQWWTRTRRSGYAYAEVALIHRRSALAICKKETRRAFFWAGLMPILIGVGSIFHIGAIFGVLLYPLQLCRIAMKHTAIGSFRWTYALFMVLAKFPEFEGMLGFCWHRLRGRTGRLIEYKR